MGYNNADFHEKWYSFLQYQFATLKGSNGIHHYLQFWPRGHGKTTGIILYVLWLIGNHPDIHIQIVSKTASQAESILSAIMTTIEFDEKYKQIFGTLKPAQPIKWTSQQFIVSRMEISKNPTVKATGIMGPITGGRSDLIIADDIIDEENIRTPLQLEKTLTWHNKVLAPTLYPWGGEIVIGTRWHYADIYANLMKLHPYDVKKAIVETETYCTSLWPKYWPIWKLSQKRREIGSIIFDCQYQNDPTPMEGDLLKGEWLHPWLHPPIGTVDYYAGIDPSMGENDYFGIAVIGVERQSKQAYLFDVWAEHTPLPAIFKHKIPTLQNQYHFSKVYFEKNFWQKLLLNIPELKRLPVVPVNTVRDKTSRFTAMSAHFESKRILVNPLLLNNSEFWTEWVQFPRGQHDDALDAVELVVSRIVSSQASEPAWLLI
jgi:predicted phage terminase large subunit-like protein